MVQSGAPVVVLHTKDVVNGRWTKGEEDVPRVCLNGPWGPRPPSGQWPAWGTDT